MYFMLGIEQQQEKTKQSFSNTIQAREPLNSKSVLFLILLLLRRRTLNYCSCLSKLVFHFILHNCNSGTVMKHYVNIWYVEYLICDSCGHCDPWVENHCSRCPKPCCFLFISIKCLYACRWSNMWACVYACRITQYINIRHLSQSLNRTWSCPQNWLFNQQASGTLLSLPTQH